MNLIEQYRMLHEDHDTFRGTSLLPFAGDVMRLINRCGGSVADGGHIDSLLDYGCGKGWQYSYWRVNRWWGTSVPELYDPAIEEFAAEPRRSPLFDGVICSDVLEHIPREDVAHVLDEVYSRARRFVFISVCPRESKRLLPDGRNCHITIEPYEWWLAQCRAANRRNKPKVLHLVKEQR